MKAASPTPAAAPSPTPARQSSRRPGSVSGQGSRAALLSCLPLPPSDKCRPLACSRRVRILTHLLLQNTPSRSGSVSGDRPPRQRREGSFRCGMAQLTAARLAFGCGKHGTFCLVVYAHQPARSTCSSCATSVAAVRRPMATGLAAPAVSAAAARQAARQAAHAALHVSIRAARLAGLLASVCLSAACLLPCRLVAIRGYGLSHPHAIPQHLHTHRTPRSRRGGGGGRLPAGVGGEGARRAARPQRRRVRRLCVRPPEARDGTGRLAAHQDCAGCAAPGWLGERRGVRCGGEHCGLFGQLRRCRERMRRFLSRHQQRHTAPARQQAHH